MMEGMRCPRALRRPSGADAKLQPDVNAPDAALRELLGAGDMNAREEVIVVKDLAKRFDGNTVLDGVSFSVAGAARRGVDPGPIRHRQERSA